MISQLQFILYGFFCLTLGIVVGMSIACVWATIKMTGAIKNIGTQMANTETELKRLADETAAQKELSAKTLAEVTKLKENFEKLKEEIANGEPSQAVKDLIAACDANLAATRANLTGADAVNEDEAAPPS